MTLIEVLIASVILFIAIGAIAGVHRVLNHYQRLNLVDYAMILNQSSFFDYISYSLNRNITSGSYKMGQYNVSWTASLNKKSKVIGSYDPELGKDIGFAQSGVISMYDVSYTFINFPGKKFEISQLVTKPSN